VGQGDEVPTAPVTVAVSLADKLDSLVTFFSSGMPPTGSKDPFALRRTGLGTIAQALAADIRAPLTILVQAASALGALSSTHSARRSEVVAKVLDLGFSQGPGAVDRLNESITALRLKFGLVEPLVDKVEGLALLRLHQSLAKMMNEPSPVIDFLIDRLKVQQREAGVRHDLIDAVFALGGEDDLVRLLARVRALQAFVETSEGADLLAGYKRAANILRKEGWTSTNPSPSRGEGQASEARQGEGTADEGESLTLPPGSAGRAPPSPLQGEGQNENKTLAYTPETEEAALIAALDSAEPRARAAVEAEDFEGAMAALASLRGPVDAFFDKVTVNDPDPAKREARLALLARMRDAVHRVADFSRIEG
jgi:glycyl-tRNA synthetase beta chain